MLNCSEVILDNVPQGIAVLDANLRVTLFNDRLRELLRGPEGVIRAGVGAKTIAAQIPVLGHTPQSSCDKSEDWLTHLHTYLTPFHQEIVVDGRMVLMTSIPTNDGGWLIICDDISALAGTW
jgi:PAS domain-containing protein